MTAPASADILLQPLKRSAGTLACPIPQLLRVADLTPSEMNGLLHMAQVVVWRNTIVDLAADEKSRLDFVLDLNRDLALLEKLLNMIWKRHGAPDTEPDDSSPSGLTGD